MKEFDEGLRAQDVHAGLRNLDPSSAILVPLADTQRVGMAAGVAALIRDLDVIEDVQNLRVIAAEQLDIVPLAFNGVLETLEEVGFITNVRRAGNRVESFYENVPIYGDLYQRLGAHWRSSAPTELEQQVVGLVDALAHAPMAYDEAVDSIGLDSGEFKEVLEVAESADLIKSVALGSDRILFSPFFGFENPDSVADIIQEHGSAEVADAFATLRGEQGMPVSRAGVVIEDAISRGLIIAPSVELPNGSLESFATLPYTIDREVLKGQKPVLEKALAVIACLRTGQHFGGYSSLSASALNAAINRLLNDGYLRPHSSSARQYRTLSRAGVIKLAEDTLPGGSWVTPTLIDTPDNRAALLLAKDLLNYGESVASRTPSQDEVGRLFDSSTGYGSPMKTVQRYREKHHLSDKKWQTVIDKMLGHK